MSSEDKVGRFWVLGCHSGMEVVAWGQCYLPASLDPGLAVINLNRGKSCGMGLVGFEG